jgi:hypothetical protein
MPNDARPKAEVELLELRVLDGPNRFFNRPAIKLEFGSDDADRGRGRGGRRGACHAAPARRPRPPRSAGDGPALE